IAKNGRGGSAGIWKVYASLEMRRFPLAEREGYTKYMAESETIPPTELVDQGVILVDHGSRRDESNAMLLDVVRDFALATGIPIVEPAHMELAEPSIATAFARCVERGATMVVVFPYFLLPGRHWNDDIPRLA